MSNDDLFPWVRQSLYRILRMEVSEVVAKAESWILATEWLGSDAETRDVVVNEIKKDLEGICERDCTQTAGIKELEL